MSVGAQRDLQTKCVIVTFDNWIDCVLIGNKTLHPKKELNTTTILALLIAVNNATI